MLNRLVFAITVVLFLCGCAPDTECRQTLTSRLNASYYAMIQNEKTGEWEPKAVSVDSLNVWGVGSDSLLYSNAKGVSKIYLPLRQDVEETQFVFEYKSVLDTLTVLHANVDNYVSLECGCYVSHTLDTLLSNDVLIQVVEIQNELVTNYDEEHVQIFLN